MRITHEMGIEEVAAFVCSRLREAGLEVFLSGDAVVSIYTHNRYESHDLDFVTIASYKKLEAEMKKMGFSKEAGRHFVHPESKIFVEFPGYAVAIDDEPIREFAERRTPYGVLKLLTPTDCVKDRLAAFYHWNDRQGLEQAVLVTTSQPVQLAEIERWSKSIRMQDRYREFRDELQKTRDE